MSTLHQINMALIDTEQRLLRATQFTDDLKRQARDTFAVLRNGIDQLENMICSSLDAQSRDLAAAIGNGRPTPETVEHEGELPIKKVKPALEEVTDA